MYTYESEERFQEHLRRLAAMSPKEKRRMLKRMEMADRSEEPNPLESGDVLVRKGGVGVHRVDLLTF